MANKRPLVIVPSVTAYTMADYQRLLETALELSARVNIDFTDGEFTPKRTINPIQSYWPEGKQIDIHMMYQDPSIEIPTLISLGPSLVILHAESRAELGPLFRQLKEVGIKTGLAFLQSTQPADHRQLLADMDHALIFAGKLGAYGGVFDEAQLEKVDQIRQIKPDIEISWDGGVNIQNLNKLTTVGVDVANVGGFIQNAADPEVAYTQLLAAVEVATK